MDAHCQSAISEDANAPQKWAATTGDVDDYWQSLNTTICHEQRALMATVRQSAACVDDPALMEAETSYLQHCGWLWERAKQTRLELHQGRGFYAWQQITRLHALWKAMIGCRRAARER